MGRAAGRGMPAPAPGQAPAVSPLAALSASEHPCCQPLYTVHVQLIVFCCCDVKQWAALDL